LAQKRPSINNIFGLKNSSFEKVFEKRIIFFIFGQASIKFDKESLDFPKKKNFDPGLAKGWALIYMQVNFKKMLSKSTNFY
jgi:hypothetical protein